MSIIASNSKNSFGKTIHQMYGGMSSGVAKSVKNPSPLDPIKQKLDFVPTAPGIGEVVDQLPVWAEGTGHGLSVGKGTGRIIKSGLGGRNFKPAITPVVRKRSAKDFA